MGIQKALMKMGEEALYNMDDLSFAKLVKENMPQKAIQQYGGQKGVREVLKRRHDPLMLLHRLTPQSLEKTKGYQGAKGESVFVNPSLQAMNPKRNSGGEYGDIVLYGNKDMLYPSKKRYADYEGEPDFFEKPRLYSSDIWSPRIPGETTKGDKKYIEGTRQLFTPENVSKYMNKRGTRAGLTDGGWATVGSYKGANATQYKNLNEADRFSRRQILPWDEYDKRAFDYSHDLHRYVSDILAYEKLPVNVTEYELLTALQEKKLHPRKKRDADDVLSFLDSPRYASIIKEIEDMAAEVPSGYYEGKVDRPVSLSEFSKALVPKEYLYGRNNPVEERTPEENYYLGVVDTLTKAGLPIGTYDRDKADYGGYTGLQEALLEDVYGKDRFTTDYLLSALPEAPEMDKEGAVLNSLLAKKPAENQPSLFDYKPGPQDNLPATPTPQDLPKTGGGQVSLFDQPTPPATAEAPATPETPPEDPMKYLDEARKRGGKITPEPIAETPAVKPEDEIMVKYGVRGIGGERVTSFGEMIDKFGMRDAWEAMPEDDKMAIIKELTSHGQREDGSYAGLPVIHAYEAIDKFDKKFRLDRGKRIFNSPEARAFREQLGTDIMTKGRASIRGAGGVHVTSRNKYTGLTLKGSERIEINLRNIEDLHGLNSVQLHESQHAAWDRIPTRNKKLILKDLFSKAGIDIKLSNKIVESVDANELMSYSFQAKYGTQYMKDYNFDTVQQHLDNIARMAKTDKISFREKIVNAVIALVDYIKMKIKYGARFVTKFDDYYNSVVNGGFKKDFATDVTQFNPTYGMSDSELRGGISNAIEMAKKIDREKAEVGALGHFGSRLESFLSLMNNEPRIGYESHYGVSELQGKYMRIANEIKKFPHYSDEEKNRILDAMGYESYAGDSASQIEKIAVPTGSKFKFTGPRGRQTIVSEQPRDKAGRWGRKDGSQKVSIDEILPNGLWSEEYPRAEDQSRVSAIEQSLRFDEEVPPIAVMKTKSGKYAVLDGNHRMQAYYNAGIDPVVKVFNSKEEAYKFADDWDKAHGRSKN